MAGDSQRNRLLEQIGRWRDQLINLTRRNRLLYFKPTKASTFLISEPALGQILRRLDNHQRLGWGFLMPAEPLETDSDEEPLGETEQPPERAADELFTQFSDPDLLQRTLRNLDRRANQEYLDKGIWILYLGVGMLVWHDEEMETDVKSPLVLKPVLISRETPRSPYRLTARDEDVVVNPSLESKLEVDFGITLPDLEDTSTDDIVQFLDKVRRKARRHKMTVLDECVVSTFSFHKEVMYRDLKENEATIADSEIVRALAAGHDSDSDLGFEGIPSERIDEEFPPERAVTILDADATQQQCLAAAASEHSFVMDGPPGTGKSQTIANMIAGAIHRGQSVLFVSEKAAALDVVSSRLAEVGLDEYLLELHSHKATRREFASRLAKSLTVRLSPPKSLSRQRLRQVVDLRKELNEYAAAINEFREPLGTSLFGAIGRVSALHHLASVPIADAVDSSLSAEHLATVLGAAAELSRAWGPVERGDGFLWRDCTAETADQLAIQSIVRDLEMTTDATSRLAQQAATAAESLDMSVPAAPGAVAPLVDLLTQMASPPAYWLDSWLLDHEANVLCDRATELAEESIRHAGLAKSLLERLGDSWHDVAPELAGSLRELLATIIAIEPAWDLPLEADSAAVRTSLSDSKKCVELLGAISASAEVLSEGFELRLLELSIEELQSIAALGSLVGLRPKPDQRWLDPLELHAAKQAAKELGIRVSAYRKKEEALSDTFSPRVLEIEDLKDLTARFEHRHRGLRKLLAAYRADKRVVAPTSRTGRATKDVIAKLPEAVAWQELRDNLRTAEQRWADHLGEHYYRGVQTDFEEVGAALDNCETLLAARPNLVPDGPLVTHFSFVGYADSQLKAAAQTVAETLGQLEVRLPSARFDESWRSLRLDDVVRWQEQVNSSAENLLGLLSGLDEVAGRNFTIDAAAQALSVRVQLHNLEIQFEGTQEVDQSLLGPGYDLWRSDWQSIKAGTEWARRVLETSPEPLGDSVVEMISDGLLDPAPLAERLDSWNEWRVRVEALFENAQLGHVVDILGGAFTEIETFLDDLVETTDDIDEWVTFRESRAEWAEADRFTSAWGN